MESKLKFGKQKRLAIMFLMTGSFMLTELVVGYCGDSLTLVADSFHMLNDVAALVVAFVTSSLSKKPWAKSTFGWERADVVGAMVNCVFLLALAFSILVEAMKRFVHPEPVIEPRWVFSVGVCGLVINLLGLCLFKDHAHSHSSTTAQVPSKHDPAQVASSTPSTIVISAEPVVPQHQHSQMNMRGVFLHVLADTMASVAVLISAAFVWGTEDMRREDPNCWKVIDYIDPALSVLIVCLIFVSTLPLLYQAGLILLQAFPSTLNIDDIKRELEKIEAVSAVEELHIWQLTGTKVVASTHLNYTDLNEYNRIKDEATNVFRAHEINFTTIEGNLVVKNGDSNHELLQTQKVTIV